MPRRGEHHPNWVDRTGQKYGKLTVVECIGFNQFGHAIWKCQCDCGDVIEIFSRRLKRGKISSCGCSGPEYKLGRNRLYQIDESVFDNIDTPDKSYWLGFLLADGYVGSRGYEWGVRVKRSDYGHLEKLKLMLGTEAPIVGYETYLDKTNKTYSGCRLVIGSKRLCNVLMNTGIMPNKSLNTKSIHNKIPSEFRRDYWRGIVDGDGCLFIGHGQRIILSLVGDINIVESFREFCDVYVDKHPAISVHKKIFAIQYSFLGAATIARTLYEDATTYLDRKYVRAKEFIRRYFGHEYVIQPPLLSI